MSSINELHPPIAQSKLLKGKVPQVTSLFWVFKVLTTGLGEAASDAVMRSFGTVAAAVAGVGLLAALFVQFACSRYRPAVYWSAVVLVAVFGTMAADIPASLGAPLWATSTVYLLIAAIVFALWFRREERCRSPVSRRVHGRGSIGQRSWRHSPSARRSVT